MLDARLTAQTQLALVRGEPVRIELLTRDMNRTVGTMLSGQVVRRYDNAWFTRGTIVIQDWGVVGQSFDACLAHGITLIRAGEVNDYVGKGLAGG